MKALAGIIIGLAFAALTYSVGVTHGKQYVEVAIDKFATATDDMRNLGKTDNDQRNSYLLGLFYDGGISIDDYRDARSLEVADKIAFIPFMEGIDWGMITFHSMPVTGDDTTCTHWIGENEFGCGTEPDSSIKCGIVVDIEKGPLKGKYLFTRPCDGVQISRRVHVDVPGTSGWDGYEIKYQDMHIIQ